MADLGGVRKSTKPLKPPTNSGTTINSGMIDQVSSSIVLCSLVFCAISFAARDLARYFVQKRNIAQKIATVKNSDIQSMKSQSASVLAVVTDALGGIQKYGESGSFGSVGSAPNAARMVDMEVIALCSRVGSRCCASCRASKVPSKNRPT